MNAKEVATIRTAYVRAVLNSSSRIAFKPSTEWAKCITIEAGVYVFFEKESIVYVGQTRSLRARMGDVRRTVNHTLRRKIGSNLFADVDGYQSATSKRKFPVHIERKVDEYMRTLTVSVVQVPFGRAEVEEYLIAKYKPRFNSISKRNS